MEEKKRIYANYRRKNKWLGVIDYQSLSLLISYAILLIFILKWIPLDLKYLFYLFVLLISPVFALVTIHLNNEDAVDMIISIFKFLVNKKIFVSIKYQTNKGTIYKNIS